jgi:hypothetical protein
MGSSESVPQGIARPAQGPLPSTFSAGPDAEPELLSSFISQKNNQLMEKFGGRTTALELRDWDRP